MRSLRGLARSTGSRSPLVEAPTASTPSAAAGVPMVRSPGPELPAAATTTTPAWAARVAASPTGSLPSPLPPRLMLITSARYGFVGSAAASMPATMSSVVPNPSAFSTLYAVSVASGATPVTAIAPPAPVPAMMPATWVPWAWSSTGSASSLAKSYPPTTLWPGP
ncbi:hypothetical protein [Micromonospora sp. DPT]|uniref:hypothetical protein n=1 Tax=Micromonospora sp. DPT TaxID=3142975 RepID=UPI00320796B3